MLKESLSFIENFEIATKTCKVIKFLNCIKIIIATVGLITITLNAIKVLKS